MLANFVKFFFAFTVIILLTHCSGDRLHSASTVKSISNGINPADTFLYTVTPVESNIAPIKKEEVRCYVSACLDTLSADKFITDEVNRSAIFHELRNFYSHNNYDLMWSTTKKPLPASELMLNTLLTAEAQGLRVEDYDVSKLINYQQRIFSHKHAVNLFQLIWLDIRLSISYISYAWHLHNGRIRPQLLPGRWVTGRGDTSISDILGSRPVTEALKSLEPQHENYKQLAQALELYRSIKYHGGWPALPATVNLRMGDSSEYVPLLKERLAATRDLQINEDEASKDSSFDQQLESAVKRFQYRHGLTVDGVVGKSTIAAMNVPVEERINEILLNMERIRWMPATMGDQYIYINVPEYKLYVYNHGDTPVEMRVIVGKEKKPTPVFNEEMEYIVFSPAWNVPKSIITKEILPKIKHDSLFLSRGNYEIYPRGQQGAGPLDPSSIDWSKEEDTQFAVVQQPGPGNALGNIKFVMPNKMNIYLHDTPADYLFQRDTRAFSHGCIRLQYPELLARYLLKDQGWDLDKITEKMYQAEPEWVRLKTKTPVYIVYRTAWVDDKGLINFRDDIYDLDKGQLDQLQHVSNKLVTASL